MKVSAKSSPVRLPVVSNRASAPPALGIGWAESHPKILGRTPSQGGRLPSIGRSRKYSSQLVRLIEAYGPKDPKARLGYLERAEKSLARAGVKLGLLDRVPKNASELEAGAIDRLIRILARPELPKMNSKLLRRLLECLDSADVSIAGPLGVSVLQLTRTKAFSEHSQPEKLIEKLVRSYPDDDRILMIQRGVFSGHVRNYEIEGVSSITYGFERGPAAARRSTIRLKGHEVEVIRPKAPDKTEGVYHSFQEVAKSLAILPPVLLAEVSKIVVEDARDASAASFKDRAYLARDRAGVIHIYPQVEAPAQEELDMRLIHEAAHNLGGRLYGEADESGKRWASWRRAMEVDVIAPSGYGRQRPAEDFAEAVSLWVHSGHVGDRVALLRAFPGRFGILQKLMQE